MASVSTIDISDKYGPKLAVYLNEGGFNRPRDLATSLTGIHIADALKSLAEPERVTFRTFETLMALEWSPVCDHVDLLVGDDSKVFPLCFNLLKLLCFHDKKKILEYAYGFMCLQFVAFTVEIGKIAQGGRLLTFQEEIAQLLPDHSIRHILNNYARELEGEGIWNNLGNAEKFVGFLGWDWGRDGYRACLPHIGGCLLTQTMPILRQLYIERKSFLSIARQAAGMFPGWGGLLYVLWNTVFENHGGQDNQKLGKKEDQDINWNCIFEIGLRYAMCSKVEEDPLIYIIINNGDLRLYLADPDHFSPVDIEDSNQVATCATQKLDSMANINDMNNMATGILMYASVLLTRQNFELHANQLYKAAFRRAWKEISIIHRMDSYWWFTFAVYLEAVTGSLDRLCKQLKGRATNSKAFQDLTMDWDLYELYAYLLLFPLSELGREIKAGDHHHVFHGNKFPDDLEYQTGFFIFSFAQHIATSGTPLDPAFTHFSLWDKITNQVQFHQEVLGNLKTSKGVDMPTMWNGATRTFPYEKYAFGNSGSQCAYARCAIPYTRTPWECGGCYSKVYCSRRCQQADWVDPHSPHELRCKKPQKL